MATRPASENPFPEILFSEVAAPAAAPTGKVRLYVKSDGLLYWKDDAGAERAVSPGADLTAHTGDASDAHDASAISLADSADLYDTVTEVEAALALLGADMYVPGIISTSVTVGDPAGNPMSNANQASWIRWRGTGTITKIGIQVVVSSGNICAAVYSPTGGTGHSSGQGRDAKPGARKATTGSIACPAAGYRELDLGGSVVIEPGDWFGFAADNTTATFIMIDDGGGGLVSNLFKGLRYYRGVFTLPDPATPDAAAMLRAPFAIGVP
jgi:hypothetical protein